MYDPTLPPRLSLAATRSSKKVSLLERESSLTPATKTPPLSLQACKGMLRSMLYRGGKGERSRVGRMGYRL